MEALPDHEHINVNNENIEQDNAKQLCTNKYAFALMLFFKNMTVYLIAFPTNNEACRAEAPALIMSMGLHMHGYMRLTHKCVCII